MQKYIYIYILKKNPKISSPIFWRRMEEADRNASARRMATRSHSWHAECNEPALLSLCYYLRSARFHRPVMAALP